ncbi:MAG: glycosyltransferase family 4 protein [Thermodesulfobacteriota bacterium]
MTERLKFCMITTFYPPRSFGGDGEYVWQLSNELARRGHHVTVIHCVDSYEALSGGISDSTYESHPNVEVHGLRSGYGFLSPLATQQTGYPLFKSGRIRDILSGGFDIIHFHNISLVGGPKILEYGSGIKLYTTHEYWLLCPTHVLMKFNRAPCTEPSCLACQLVHGRPPQLWRYTNLMKNSLVHLDAIISPSRFTKKLHEDSGLNTPIFHIPHFAPLSADASGQDPNGIGASSGKPYFLYVGRIEKLKGIQTLIPAFRGYGKADLLIAGKGDYEARVRKLAEGADNIRFLGHLSRDRLGKLYRDATALIVPSIAYEISTLVVFEAFREKTPVIVNDIGGLPELVEESGGGFVYGSEGGLLRAMDRILEEPGLRDELGRKGHEKYLEKWNADAHLKSYLELITKLRQGAKYSGA